MAHGVWVEVGDGKGPEGWGILDFSWSYFLVRIHFLVMIKDGLEDNLRFTVNISSRYP